MALCLVGNRKAKGLMISHQMNSFRELKTEEFLSVEENKKLQSKRLLALIIHACQTVPYYRDLHIDVDAISEENVFEEIKKFPILTKDIIRKEGDRLYSEVYTKSQVGDWMYEDTSGGTTGEPVKFLHSGHYFDSDQGAALFADEFAGRKIGDFQIRLWGSERDIISGKKDWMNKIYRWMRAEMFLNTFQMNDATMAEYVRIINKKKPKMILAYAQSAREIAKYIEDNNISVHSPNGVMTSAGTLDNDTYELLKRVFKCPVINRYGSREVGCMACSCEKNEGLHINSRGVFVETLRDDGTLCDDEEEGRIIVTNLQEYAMPLIRYEIGDVGSLTKHACSCGRGLPMLKKLSGRIVGVFLTEDGNRVDGEYFTHLFYNCKWVKQFQVIQEGFNDVVVNYISTSEPDFDTLCAPDMTAKIRLVMGEKCNVTYNKVDDIPETKSGKRAYTIRNF